MIDALPEPRHPWRSAAAAAVPAVALIVALMAAYFTFGNRYVVFLYHHDMGPRVPDTGPFSPVTRSRYWMTGLVATGLLAIAGSGVHLVLGRLRPGVRLPRWWRVWLLAAGPLLIAVPAITMLTHSPRLPLWLATLTTAATLAGLALALMPARLIAARPVDAALLGLDGLALALWLTTLPGLQYVSDWIAGGRSLFLIMLGLLPTAGLFGLAALTLLRVWLRRPMPAAGQLGLAGLLVAYLGLPAAHHLFATAGRFYITDMDNFFARDPAVQAFIYLATGSLVWAISRLRRRWDRS